MSRLVAAFAAALLLIALPASALAQDDTKDVLMVGNNWDGTADVVDVDTFKRIARLNIIPDIKERMAEIDASPDERGYFLAIRQLVGEGHDQFVDDMFTSHDGRYVYVSRPSLKDVIGMELRTGKIVWRTQVEGYRADHMAISPDGTRLLVSASTARKVHVIDTANGKIVGEFESGDQPHENNYSLDGTKIFHASIGTVYTPTDQPAFDNTKGDRWFEVVDARTNKVLKRLDMGQKLEEAGYPDMSAAVRPMAIAPDETRVYFQVSFFHGLVEFDLVHDKVLRLLNLPLSESAAKMRREEYLLDSAHHGLAMNPEGTKLCAAGTMSDYAAIVDRADFSYKIINVGQKPYWSTNSGDGKYCFVSVSGEDKVVVISYAEGKQVASIPVGDHPQRMRMGKLQLGLLGTSRSEGRAARRGQLRVRLLSPSRTRARRRPTRVRVRVTLPRGGKMVPAAGARVQMAGVVATTDRQGRATLRKRYGFESVRRYRVRATLVGYRSGTATIRAVRRR